MYYNPHAETKTITIKAAKGKKVDLYDTISGKFIAKNVKVSAKVTIPPKGTAVIVMVPAKRKVTRSGSKILVDNVVIDYKQQKNAHPLHQNSKTVHGFVGY